MADNKVEQLLATSILPALLKMIQVSGQSAEQHTRQQQQVLEAIKASMMPNEWRTMLIAVDDRLKSDNELSEVVQLMVNSITELNKPISQLVESTNKLGELQAQQNKLLYALQQTFVENTSRLDLLTISVQKDTDDKALKGMFKDLDNASQS